MVFGATRKLPKMNGIRLSRTISIGRPIDTKNTYATLISANAGNAEDLDTFRPSTLPSKSTLGGNILKALNI